MALVLKDRVKETAAAPGTGTITLGGAAAGFQSFSSVGNGNVTYFAIVDGVSGDWEVNYGTYTTSGSTLTRNSTPLSSSNSGALVNFTGTVDVFITYPSEQAVWQDTSGVVAQQSFGAITATSAALTTGTVSTSPASATDIANKQYVDGLVASGITYHTPVKYEVPNTTGNLNATYNQPGGPGVGVGATLTNAGTLAAFAPDGPTASVSDRILIYNQTNAFENGIYTVTTVGSGSVAWVLTRATDADTYALKSTSSLGNGDAFFITSGNTGAGETYVCNTVGTITFGTTAITFAQISDSTLYTAGTGLTLSGTEFSITPTGTAGTYGSASSVPVLTTNASGQVTSVTNTNIAINGSAVSGNISGSAGSVANALTLGTYLTGTSFNGSAAVTATVDATSANTASKVVARDSSGNFSAGTITATLSGSATSATTATNIAGGVANQIPYQTAAGTTSFITAASGTNYVLNYNGSTFNWVSGTISGVTLGSNLNSLTAGTYLTGTAYNGSAAQTWTVDATSANTASKVVARDASGNFSAGTITAALSGNATTATTATNLAGGAAGTIPYQSAAGTTVQLTAGTAGYILQSNGAAAPSWVVASTAAGVNNGTLTMAVSGTGLSGSATFTANQAGASTFTVTSNATSANTASAIVARDASGNFSAGTITATLSGNASTATSATSATSATTATNLAGGSAGTVPYQSAAGTTVQLAAGTSGYVLKSNGAAAPSWTVATISGIALGSNLATLTFGTYLTGTSYNGSTAVTIATNATNANTASTIVARDASGNFSAGTITAALSGNATTATTATNLAGGATGSIAYQSGAGATTFLADVATGNALISGGVGVAPSYGKIGLTTHVSGTLPIANGGTNSTATPTAGGVVYGNGSAYAVTSAGTAGQVLTSNGTSAPTFQTSTAASKSYAQAMRILAL
jgi:hypothetical protein